MSLDNRTLYLALMITSAVMTVALCAFWRSYPSVRGARTIGIAMISVSVGALLVAFRDVAPDFLSIVGCDILLLGGIILATDAFRDRCGLARRPQLGLVVLAAQLPAILYLYFVEPSVVTRVVVFSVASAIILGMASADLLRARAAEAKIGPHAVGTVFGMLAAFMAVRAVVSPLQGEIDSFVTTDRWLQTLPTIIGIVLAIGLGLAFMAMAFAEADRALQQANDGLRRSNVELDRFAAVASHDLKAPLSNVIGYLDLLHTALSRSGDAENIEYATAARQCALQMNALIGELLAYARLREGAVEKLVPADLGVACRRAIEWLAQRAAETGASIDVGPLPVVQGDQAQLIRLFRNLIDNAIKYRCPGRPLRITIGASQDGGDWKIFVADNGLGVPLPEQTRIFEPFRRADNAAGIEGTGFGLSISRLIVERHGGRIWVDSEPGVGSTFAFTMPARPRSAPAETPDQVEYA